LIADFACTLRSLVALRIVLGNQTVYGMRFRLYGSRSGQLIEATTMSDQSHTPLQNRVTPDGDIVAVTARGDMFGNRGGRIHGSDQRLGSKRWHSKQWICCILSFKQRRRPVMAPNRYTELFFLDEATALSAGHRPCFECRREAAMQFATLWNGTRGLPGRAIAGDMDDQLHSERVSAQVGKPGKTRTEKPVWSAQLRNLPDATFARWHRASGAPTLTGMLLAKRFLTWTPDGYASALPVAPDVTLDVLTPKSIVAVLRAGYVPGMHKTANIL
jgi:hypothetical protein